MAIPTPSPEHAVVETLVAATPDQCFAVVADLASYPEWTRGVTAVEIRTVDDEGRAEQVEFRAEAMGRATRYTLEYDYSEAPLKVAWRLLEGDLTRKVEGSYTFSVEDENPGQTRVVYELSVDLVVPLPGFVKRRAETKIMQAALPEFKARVESLI